MFFLLIGSLIFLFSPTREELTNKLEKYSLPTPAFANREQLLEILNNFSHR